MTTPPTQPDEVIRLNRPSPAPPQPSPADPPRASRAPKQISFAAVFALSSIVSAMWITLIGMGFWTMSDYRIVQVNRSSPDAGLSQTNEQLEGLRHVLRELVDTAELTASQRETLEGQLERGLNR